MKKFLILLLTFVTLVSVLSVSVFAESSENVVDDVNQSVDIPSKDISKDDANVSDTTKIPTIGAIDGTEESECSCEACVKAREEADEGETKVELKLTTDNMGTSLKHMGVGLLGVMIVLSLIAVVVVILNKASGKK